MDNDSPVLASDQDRRLRMWREGKKGVGVGQFTRHGVPDTLPPAVLRGMPKIYTTCQIPGLSVKDLRVCLARSC